MGLTLLLPLGLVALAAWLLPLLIHLARRQESRLTEFAALRWLRARPKPRNRVRFDEWPLLLLRLLLLALLALLLAGLALRGHEDTRPRVAVSTGADPATARTAFAAPRDAHWVWLAPGFPPIDTPSPTGPQPNASLLRELDAQLPAGAPLTVLVPATWTGVDAQRPRLSRPVDWRVLPAPHLEGAPTEAAARAARGAPQLRVAGGDADALRYLRALQRAWHGADAVLAMQAGDAALPATDGKTLLVWLSPAPLPAAWQAWLHAGGQVLIEPRTPLPASAAPQPQWRDESGRVLLDAIAVGRGRIWRLAAPLRAQTLPQVLDADFPSVLLSQLQPPPAPGRVDSASFAPSSGQPSAPAQPRPLIAMLAALIALLFLIERAWATSPRRGARA